MNVKSTPERIPQLLRDVAEIFVESKFKELGNEKDARLVRKLVVQSVAIYGPNEFFSQYREETGNLILDTRMFLASLEWCET